MGILSWVLFGLIAGIIAKLIMPGKQGGGFIKTSIIGIAGAFVGGYAGTFLGMGDMDNFGFDIGSFAMAVGGALILLFVYRIIKN